MSSKVLIAPLNWGLGHATRCVPVIQSFQDKGWEIIIASDGIALDLLKKEFPTLPTFELPGYHITYPYQNAVMNMMFNGWNFFRGILSERKMVKTIVEKESLDLIISDNRYGVYSRKIKSVFIGHQINLLTGNRIISSMATWLNKRMIRKFTELWIPDFEGNRSLTGKLSDTIPGLKSQYIGPLSRFEKRQSEYKFEICAIISGPEPQRTLFEEELIDQLSQLNENTVIILGRINEEKDQMLNENTRVISYLTSKKLNEIVNQSRIVIARSGYSTIMDLVKLNKKAILVPTPGQTEQAYLAKFLKNGNLFVFQEQDHLNIPEGLEELVKLDRKMPVPDVFDIENVL